MKNSESKKDMGYVCMFEELGVYSSDSKKDQEINRKLKAFLKSLGVKLAKIKIRKN